VETSDGKRLDEELIKQLSGQDKLAARELYKDYFEFRPECKMWLVTNHKPIIQGTDNGIWRRIYLIPFDVVIPENEQDKRLGDKLRAELSGILNWCIEGFNEWINQGITTPEKIQEATREYRVEMDKLGSFLYECCDLNKEFKSSLEDLYVDYLDWCRTNEEFSNNKRMFSRQLKERGFLQRKSTGGRKPFWGLRLKVAEVAQVAKFPQSSPNKKHFSPSEFREKTATSATSATISTKPMSNTNKVILLEDEWDEGSF
jgi:putative DNA primase/helicase